MTLFSDLPLIVQLTEFYGTFTKLVHCSNQLQIAGCINQSEAKPKPIVAWLSLIFPRLTSVACFPAFDTGFNSRFDFLWTVPFRLLLYHPGFSYLLGLPSSGGSMEYNNISVRISINCRHLAKRLISRLVSRPLLVLFKEKGWFSVITVWLTPWNDTQTGLKLRPFILLSSLVVRLHGPRTQILLLLAARCNHGRPGYCLTLL